MTNWTSGYVAEIGYTHGFYRELVPEILRFAALVVGDAAAQPREKLTYCELGCGQGFSANLIAAANPAIQLHATDFNPSQIAGARRLAEEAGLSNAHFYDHAFADFAAEPALPAQFDIIAIHGIYSWISAENRGHIVDFIRSKLKPGGTVYISYNTLPGWAAAMPLRRLMVDHAATVGGTISERIDAALAFVERLIAANAAYFVQNPTLAARFERLKGMPRAYLAHEYFNADWTPFHFADVAAELDGAKLSFLSSVSLLDHIPALNLTADQQALMAPIADPVRRESFRDLAVNQQFRRDLFVKGALPLSSPDTLALWLDQRFALVVDRAAVPDKVTGILEGGLQPEVYGPLLTTLSAGPTVLRQMLAVKEIADLGWQRLIQALTVLVGAGHVQPCLPVHDEARRSKSAKAFNTAVMRRAAWSTDLQVLASPVTGGGVAVDRIQQLFLTGLAQKGVDPARHAWSVLAAQGQQIIKDGTPLEGEAANVAELELRLADFTAKRLPVLKQLGIV